MMNLIDTVTAYQGACFRNTIGFALEENTLFDDLTDEADEQTIAVKVTQELNNRFLLTAENIFFNAIDYVFERKSWCESRFSDGHFAAWYASNDVETTFYETIFHWKKAMIDDVDFDLENVPVYTSRTVFNVFCSSDLIDLRTKTPDFPTLISQNTNCYFDNQKIGRRLYEQGFPGLITPSSRHKKGDNLVIFNKTVLSRPKHQGNYLYELNFQSKKIHVLDERTHQNILEIY
ncbi:MAG: RES family NAD+ phosphorylase [Legionellales bacterium]|nr:RES family NAD+ phosphorylase [Legionellales bacterium]